MFQGLSTVNYDIDISDTSAESSAGVSPHPSHVSDHKDLSLEMTKIVEGAGLSSLLDTSSPTSKLLLPSPMKPVAPSCTDHPSEEQEHLSQIHSDVGHDTSGPKISEGPVSASGSEYQGFTAQGWKIQSIPCDTGTSDLKSSQTRRSKEEVASGR